MLVDLRLLYSLGWVVWDALPVFRFRLFFAQPSVMWKQGCGAAFNNQPLRAPGMSVEKTGVNAAFINLRRILARQRRRGMMEGSRIVV